MSNSLNKFLTLINGVRTIVSAISISTGVGNANRIVATGNDGKLDISLMPSGFQGSGNSTATTESMVASEALSAGDFVNIWNNSGTRNARRANASLGRVAHGFVLASVNSGASATVNLQGENTSVSATLTPGSTVFLSDATPGAVTAIAPTTSGHISQELGYAVSPNSLMFDYAGYVQL